jgi:16S rRNA (cytidine1402-2'-O)-methyltransferase
MAAGILTLVATPIGNLGDFSPRAIEVLKSADLIAAEDTRNTLKLLNHFEIRTPMTAYHEYNRFDKADELVEQLLAGKNVACVTDAGMPGISDPGEVLVAKCAEAGITVTAVPGPSAGITALVLSGLPTRRYRFEGFLPSDKKEREAVLADVKNDSATLIFYEAPHRLEKTLEVLCEALGDRRTAIVKELTKLHENVLRTSLSEALRHFREEEPRGEYVIVVEGRSFEEKEKEKEASWQELSIEEHLRMYEEQGMDRKEAMKRAAKDRGVGKREIYDAVMKD